MPTALSIENLGKCYRISHNVPRSSYRTLRETVAETAARSLVRLRGWHDDASVEEFWAIRDIDLRIEQGEVVGIIGRNGAGKSTLLKILSRIAKPTTGRARMIGRVSSLLEVGTGFHPELTGRENIYLNGAILGMSRAEIDRNFDAIVAFSGVEQFLDTPVKRYSSGMQVRLAFSVAAHLEPEILIVDEVLAVGDAEFQRKCLGRMENVARSGRTILFVSHNMPAIRSITSRCIFLKGGQLRGDGPTDTVIDQYLQDTWDTATESEERASIDYYRRDKNRDSTVTIRDVEVLGGHGSPPRINSGEPILIKIHIAATKKISAALVDVALSNQRGERVVTIHCLDTRDVIDLVEGSQYITCRIDRLPLSPGRYTITVGVNRALHTIAYDVIVDFPALEIVLPEVESGEYPWPQRRWGCIHWRDVSWTR